MTLRGRKVLVTGATGFIGTALVRRLLRDRAEVFAFTRGKPLPDKVHALEADLADESSLIKAVKAANPEVVFHLAKQRDGYTFEREAAATVRLSAVLKEHAPGLRRLVRIAHDAPSRQYDEALAKTLTVPAVTLELFQVYGPGQAAGDFPRSYIEGRRPERLPGAIVDFVYIDDVIAALLLASHASGVEGLTIPIGTGAGRTAAEAAALILSLTGSKDVPPQSEGPGAGHPADPSLARRMLLWTPRVLLEQGLARALGAAASRPKPAEERRHMIPWLGAAGGKSAKSPLGAKAPWNLVGRAAANYRKGDLAAASRDADSFIGLLPGSAAGPAMKALLAAQKGDRAETERWLEASGPEGPEGWARALRGMMRARWGEHEAARLDLDATRRVEKSAWASAERADAYNRAGEYWSALSELSNMRRAMPDSPEPDLRASAIHLEQAQYEEAASCLKRAEKLAPRDPAVARQLSRVRFVEGNLPAARLAIEQACRLAADDVSLRQERLRLCVLLDDDKAVAALLKLDWAPGVTEYWRAYAACRKKNFAESLRRFEAAEQATDDERFAAKCRYHRFVARVIASGPALVPAPKNKELIIMGLGFRMPDQTSVEVLWALRGCEEIFSNLSDSTVPDMLGLYGVPMRTIVFRRSDGQSTPCARIVMKAMKGLGRGGVVTRGMPNFYGRLAYRLVLDCAARGISCKIPPSTSIADLFPALTGTVSGMSLGLEVRDTNNLAKLDPRLPVVVYNFPSGEQRRKIAGYFQSLFPADAPCWLMAGSGYHEYEPTRTTLSELGAALDRADAAVTVLLPARR